MLAVTPSAWQQVSAGCWIGREFGLTFAALVRPLPQPEIAPPQVTHPKPAPQPVAPSGVSLKPLTAHRSRVDRRAAPALEAVAANH